MELQDSILKDFADAVNNNNLNPTIDSQHIYAVVTRTVEDGLVYVQLNGAEIETPAATVVQVGNDDKVLCAMRGHTLTVIGNLSYPSLTRVGKMYMTMTDSGLLIGEVDDKNTPTGQYIIVGPDGTSIYNGKLELIATFGESAQLGRSGVKSDVYLTLTQSGVAIRKINNNGVAVILANFTASGMSFRDENGNVLASFDANNIRIGTSSAATISMCGGTTQIALDGTTLKIYGGSNVGAIGLSNSYGTYKSEVVCEAKNNSPKASMQLMNGSTTITSLVLSNSGANVTTTGGALTENGQEVVKVNDIVATGSITTKTKTVSPGTANITATITPPTGYKIVGMAGWAVNCSAWPTDINVKRIWISGNELTVYLENVGESNRSVNVVARWFAVRTSGITNGGSQTNIDW